MCKSSIGKKLLRMSVFLLNIVLFFSATACVKAKNDQNNNYEKDDKKYDMINFSALVDNENHYFQSTQLFLHQSKEIERVYARGAAVNPDTFATVISVSTEMPIDADYTDQETGDVQQWYLCSFSTNGDLKNKTDIRDIVSEQFAYVDSISLTKSSEIYMVVYPPLEITERQNQIWLYHLDENHNLMSEKAIIPLNPNIYPYTFIDYQGNIYMTGYDDQPFLAVLSPSGKELFTIQGHHEEYGNLSFGFISFTDGNQVYIDAINTDGSTLIFPIDIEKKDFGDPIDLDFMTNAADEKFQSGVGQFLLTSNKGIFRINPETGEQKIALLWENQDVYTINTIKDAYMLSEDLIILQQTPYTSQNSSHAPDTQFFLLKRADNPNLEKRIIRIGGYGISNNSFLQNAVFTYNQTQREKRVIIEDYQINEPSDSGNMRKVIDNDALQVYTNMKETEEASSQLKFDFLSGNVPDILYGKLEDFGEVNAANVLTDLQTYIKNDPAFKMDDYYDHILTVGSHEESLYKMNLSFRLQGLVAAKSVVGERDSWTFDDFESFAADLPDGKILFNDISQNMLLYHYVSSSTSELFDESNMKATLDSQEFRKALHFAKTYGITEKDAEQKQLAFGQNDLYQSMLSGEIVFLDVFISELTDLMGYISVFNEPLVFTGYLANKEKGIPCYIPESASIPKDAVNPEDAWEFICFLLSEETQMQLDSLPIRKSAMENMLERYIQLELMIGSGSSGAIGLSSVPLRPLSKEDADILRSLIARVDTEHVYRNRIMNIITEEAAPFFTDQKTVDDVIKIMQSRVQTFLDEM